MSKIHIDVVIDVAYGDCGKGKITHHLATENKSYTHVMRTSGGQNAGHTIYHKSKKYATHMVPSGVFHGITSVIGSGCVFHPESLLKEIKEIESQGDVEVLKYLKIAKNCHIVTNEHLEEEAKESKIGTTKRGIGPAYRDKYARTGIRAEEALKGTVLESCLVDLYEEFYVKDAANFKRILVEGAQGFYLDIDWGDYPFVTSSHCGLGGVFLNGFTHKQIDTVYGAIKTYETYVGSKQFEDTSNPLFAKIRELGVERGVTTGRNRQVNWINIDELKKACEMNAVDVLVVSKMDILKGLREWHVRNSSGEVTSFKTEEEFKGYIQENLKGVEIKWSYSPEKI